MISTTEAGAFLIVFILSFVITISLIPLMVYLGRKWGVTARAGGRRQSHVDVKRISKLGGVAIFLGFTITVMVAQYLNVPRFDSDEVGRLVGLILGGTFIFIVGVIDDVLELKASWLGLAQIIVASIAVGFNIFIETFNNPFSGQQTDNFPFVITVILTMFWLALMMNTVNFMDGLDGLASGVAFIAGAMLFINSAFVLSPPQTSVSLLPLALMGASAGFLCFNFYPAKIIMGGGAYFLGYTLGTLSIIGGAKMATILLVMGLPLMDLTWQVVNRLRDGRNPMRGDRGHIHFRLQDIGFGQRQIVSIYYLFCTFFGILTLITTSQLFKFVAFGVMLILIASAFVWLIRFDQTESSASS